MKTDGVTWEHSVTEVFAFKIYGSSLTLDIMF